MYTTHKQKRRFFNQLKGRWRPFYNLSIRSRRCLEGAGFLANSFGGGLERLYKPDSDADTQLGQERSALHATRKTNAQKAEDLAAEATVESHQ